MILALAATFTGAAMLTGVLLSLRRASSGAPAKLDVDTGPPPPLPQGWAPYHGARPEPLGWPSSSVLAVRGLAKQPPEVREALFEVCETLGVPVDTLAAVIAHESGWNPKALYFRDKSDDGSPRKVPFVAAGICQLTVEAHLEGFGDWQRVREVSTWPVQRQLREVVLPLWAKYGARVRGAHPGLGLMLNFLPDKAGMPEGTVLGEKDGKGFPGKVYAMNSGLDTNHDGKITIGDVYASAARVCRGAQGRRLRLDGSLWTPPPMARVPESSKASARLGTPAPAVLPAPSSPKVEPGPVEHRERIEAVTAATPPEKSATRALRLGDSAGGFLIAAIRANEEEAPTWADVLWEGRGKTAGVKLILKVSTHCVRAPVEIEGLGKRLLRLPISYQEQLEVCRLRRWFPLSQTISDAIWVAARRLTPPTLGKWDTPAESAESSRKMGTLDWVVQFNDRLDRQIPPESWTRLSARGADCSPAARRAHGRQGCDQLRPSPGRTAARAAPGREARLDALRLLAGAPRDAMGGHRPGNGTEGAGDRCAAQGGDARRCPRPVREDHMNREHALTRSEGRPQAVGPRVASRDQLLSWYRERDRDEMDLHRRYVRAKYRMVQWSDADLARFHRYRRSLPRERAAQLVIARRYALRGLTVVALAALMTGLLYAAYQWWSRRSTVRVLPAGTRKSS
ncbi:MAG: hypothetical protein R3B70_25965 [Polyangiaceae bacterium]